MSDTRQVVATAEFEPLLRRWSSIDWRWDRTFLDRLLEDLGWRVEAEVSGILRARTSLPTASVAITNLSESGELTSLAIFGTSAVPVGQWSDPDAKRFLRDAFVDVVRGVTDVLGEPTERIPGDEPEVRWALRGATLAVGVGPAAVELTILSPAQVEKLARDVTLRFEDDVDDDF